MTRPEPPDVHAVRFLQWVWPAMYCLVAALTRDRFTLLSWIAPGVALALYQLHRSLDRNPQYRPGLNPAGAGAFVVLLSGLFWPWRGWGIPTAHGAALMLVLLGTLLREIHESTREAPVWDQRFHAVSAGITVPAELAYTGGWLFLAGALRGDVGPGWGFLTSWLREPYPLILLLTASHLVALQSALVINPAHDRGREWFLGVSKSNFILILLTPFLGVFLGRFGSSWWFVGLLWMYAYRTDAESRKLLQGSPEAKTHAPAPDAPEWLRLRQRWFRQTLYVSLVLMALLYLHFTGSVSVPGG